LVHCDFLLLIVDLGLQRDSLSGLWSCWLKFLILWRNF